MTREQAQRFLEEYKIRYMLAQFVDIHGAAKAKAVQAALEGNRADRLQFHLHASRRMCGIVRRPHG